MPAIWFYNTQLLIIVCLYLCFDLNWKCLDNDGLLLLWVNHFASLLLLFYASTIAARANRWKHRRRRLGRHWKVALCLHSLLPHLIIRESFVPWTCRNYGKKPWGHELRVNSAYTKNLHWKIVSINKRIQSDDKQKVVTCYLEALSGH